MITLYNAISSDGFIAEKDGNEDFIPYDAWYDFIELCGHYDAVVMGKNSYNSIQNYDVQEMELFEKLSIKKVVVSSDKRLILKNGYNLASTIKEALSFGKNILLASGPTLNDVFLKNKLIDVVILNVMPVEIHDGIKQFDKKEPEIALTSEKHLHEGRVLRTYNVVYN